MVRNADTNECLVEVFGGGGTCEDERTMVRDKELLDEAKKKANVRYFSNLNDFMLTNALVSVRHAFPEFNDDQAIVIAKILMRRASLPANEASWHRPRTTINRLGMKGALARVLLELSRGYYD